MSLWDQLCYLNIILTGRIQESALIILSKQVLLERGTLPVGEVGKILQELTCTVSLSGRLKERYGGLKKFLELYPEDFTICADHPFNPHLFLTALLSPDDMELVINGTVPAHLTAKYKKVC